VNGLLYTQTDPTVGHIGATAVDPPGAHWVGGEPTSGHMGLGCSLMSTVALFMPPSHRKQSVRLSVCLSVPA